MMVAANASEGQKPGLSIRLFGSVEVQLNGAPLPSLRSRKGHWLLALLTLRHGRTVERDWLAGTLWPESPAAASLHNLRNSLTDLRRALGPEAARLQAPTPHTLCLDLAGVEADVAAFEEAVRQGDRASLEAAVAIYRGPLVEGCAEEWAFEERQTRKEAVLQALEALARQARDIGELGRAEGHLRRAVAVDPLRESAQRQLMQVLAAAGNYPAVLQLHRELRLRLHHDLNTEPDPETTLLFQQLRSEARRRLDPLRRRVPAQRVDTLPSAAGTHAIAGATTGSLTVHTDQISPPGSTTIHRALPASLVCGRMVGRDGEFSELKHQVDAALEGTGAAVFLRGEPGIGKTRLATEVGVYARQQGFRVLTGRCDEQGAAPYQPLAEALREYLDTAESWRVEQVMPPSVACELVRPLASLRSCPQIASQVKEIPQVPPEQTRQALTDALRQFFALVTTHDAPVLLFLDDLHWADEGSLALLHALARQTRNMRLLILGTYRDVELDPQHPLERTLAALNRERLSRGILLRRLCEQAVARMIAGALEEAEADLAHAGPHRELLALLHRQTEGNPFFIEEVLKHLVEEGAIYPKDGRWQIQLREPASIPHSIKVTIGRRLQRLSPESRGALALAAVIGQQFSFDVLLKASELEEERLLGMVEEWLGAHLVVEQRVLREEVYRFQHALIRAVPYEALSLRRKARLHERVGLALEAVYAGALEEHLDELAYHFAQARSETAAEKGVDYCLRAGEKARNLYANEEAIQHLTAALELLEGLPEDEPHLRKRWDVVFHLAKAHLACRAFERAQDVLQDYLALAQRAGYPWGMAAGYCEMGWVLRESHQALGLRSESARRLRMENFEKSLQIAEQHGLTDWQAPSRMSLAYLLLQFRYDLPRAEALLRETLQAPEALSEEDVQEASGRLVQVCALQGKWDEVAAALRRRIPFGASSAPAHWRWSSAPSPATPLSILFGTPSTLAHCLGPMEDALNRAGKQAEFVAFCEEAKALYAEVGAPLPLNQWYLQPATPSEEFPELLFRDDFDALELRPEWHWHDPAQVSTYSLREKPGSLTLRAGLGANLWPRSNLNAPRMLLEVRGDFALETKMAGDWDVHSAISGLLVWKDVLNYVRAEKYSMRRWQHGSVQLEARIGGELRTVGRGLLRGNTFHLRIERTGERFVALCSADGVHWLSCGEVVLPVKDPLLVGVVALEGMVVHFDYVQITAGRAPG